MVLTFSLVINRLDQLNSRERQVREFYKPLPTKKKNEPFSAGRHRFADALEPGDVVKPIGKSEKWDNDDLSELSDAVRDNTEVHGVQRASALSDTSPSIPRVRGRYADPVAASQRSSVQSEEGGGRTQSLSGFGVGEAMYYTPIAQHLAPEVNRIGAQMHESVMEKTLARKEMLKKQLCREVGLPEDGSNRDPDAKEPIPEDTSHLAEPLFKLANKMPRIARKRPDR